MSIQMTVIIPTKDRSDVLRHCIMTCVNQDYDNLRIIVSDNYSSDDTEEVVRSFDDNRIQYINPGQRLGMPEHWEFALQHVETGYVTILGDDDGLLPMAVQKAAHILQHYRSPALAWRKASYFWPQYMNEKTRNVLEIPLSFGEVHLTSIDVISGVVNNKRGYVDLPCLYNSFVLTDVINHVKNSGNGKMFNCINPDIYSGFCIALSIKDYIFSREPLSINGASAHSNGTITMLLGTNNNRSRSFFDESNIKIDERLAECPSIDYYICDVIYKIKDIFGIMLKDINLGELIENSLKQAARSPRIIYDEVCAAARAVIEKNNLAINVDGFISNSPYISYQEYDPLSQGRIVLVKQTNTLIMDSSEFGVSDVYGASKLSGKAIHSIKSDPDNFRNNMAMGIFVLRNGL